MQMFDTHALNVCTWIELNVLFLLVGQAILVYLINNSMFVVASHRGNLQQSSG
jgi:hypothetical protein